MPTTLNINAWNGESFATAAVSAQSLDWVTGTKQLHVTESLGPPADADPADWRDPSVGWGLILPERPGLSSDELSTGSDAPESIRQLLKQRNNAPVFRYRPASPNRFTLLRNYAAGKDISIDPAVPSGVGTDALPQYLLIYGSPAQIPWDFQYVLNATCAVGRLDLEGDALENYIQALLNNWQNASSQIDQAVMWAVDFGAGDISHLMRNAIAASVYEAWNLDPTLHDKAVFFDGSTPGAQANAASLIAALSAKKPALIVTTSHGQTGPLGDPTALKLKLGLPVDQDFKTLEHEQLLAAWEPDGAIWYAHACCSAGSDAITIYDGLVDAGSPIDQVLKGVASLGAQVAPLPTALLGAKKPLRAFIGHVEPTFDWTLRQPSTGQFLTNGLKRALYSKIYRAKPVGLAFREYYQPLGALSIQYEQAFKDFKNGKETHEIMLFCQLASRDLQSMVILGDPTAVLPPLP
ncbi:MAG TPA: hypothetical protein VIY29_06530 [Ktedonobacteraceae bacterium]